MTTEEIARQMADVLLHVAVYFNLESWERDLTEEERGLMAKVNAALDNEFGQAARDAVQEEICRDTDRAIASLAKEGRR